MKVRLIERLKRFESGDTPALGDDLLHHLRLLFNTRTGSTLSNWKYGFRDINDLALESRAVEQTVKEEIVRVIREFEPRLSNVTVTSVTDESSHQFNFEITAEVFDNALRFRAEVNDNGLLSID